MKLFDTHFHFDGTVSPAEYRALLDATLAQLPQSAVGPVERLYAAAMGDDFESSLKAQKFAEEDSWSVFAVGVHPHGAEAYEAAKPDFALFRGHPKLRAVGELGLDYFYDWSEHLTQQRVLARFLELALEWQLPAVIHLRDQEGKRDAYADALPILTEFARSGGRFVVHCYAGSADDLEQFLMLGAWVGVTGMVTFRKAENVRSILPLIPQEKLLLETDTPYLAPVPHRGETNQPGFLPLVAQEAARTLHRNVEAVAEATTANAMKFYGLSEDFEGLWKR